MKGNNMKHNNRRTELDTRAEFNLKFARYLDGEGEHEEAKRLRTKAMLQLKRRGKYKVVKSFPESAYERRIINDDGIDGYVEKLILSDKYDRYDKDTIEEFFDCWIDIDPIESTYDCTGRSFTNWHKVAKLGNKWVIYHSVGFDV